MEIIRSKPKKNIRKTVSILAIGMGAAIVAIFFILLLCTSFRAKKVQQNFPQKNVAAAATSDGTTAADSAVVEEPQPLDYTLCFAGDISAADDARTTQYWIRQGRDITKCIDATMIDYMQDADICFVNNEFQYSKQGTAMPGKPWTFRADPENVSIMEDLGVDIVSLANNHVYDFGEAALLDTMDTLSDANIPYVGAGKNLDEASSIYYYDLGGFTVAFLSGTRIEWTEQTKGATESTPGVFRTVDPSLLYARTKEADANADYVIVYMHWGIEAVTYQEEYQTETGHCLIDSGADAVIGDHPHWLQGMEFYKGKPILYSMGNYWFNGKSMDTMLAQLHISGTAENIETSLQLIPGRQSNCQVEYYDEPEEQAAFYQNMEALSSAYGISIDEEGYVTEQTAHTDTETMPAE